MIGFCKFILFYFIYILFSFSFFSSSRSLCDFNYGSRWFHLAFNLIVQLLVGLPLEMVHGSTRIGCVYLAGVLAGSMGTSVFDPEVYLVGASGGVYALLAAHLANVMLNYNNMHYGIIRIVGIFLFGKLVIYFIVRCMNSIFLYVLRNVICCTVYTSVSI